MKVGPLFKKIIYSSWFLAGRAGHNYYYFFFRPIGSKYKLDVEPSIKNAGNYIYADLNADSISELIIQGKESHFIYVSVRIPTSFIYDQWNLKDSLNPAISELFFGNYDHDRFSEIYVFSYKGDSLFLNMNEILSAFRYKNG